MRMINKKKLKKGNNIYMFIVFVICNILRVLSLRHWSL